MKALIVVAIGGELSSESLTGKGVRVARSDMATPPIQVGRVSLVGERAKVSLFSVHRSWLV